ncbi:MAG: ATP-binding protein, partial [Nitrososphaerota archaeon]|nr:ATP-binding protein [Nitrososphaerota archaeon]
MDTTLLVTIIGIIVGGIITVGCVFLDRFLKKRDDKKQQPVTPQPVAPQPNNTADNLKLVKFPYSRNEYFTGRAKKLETIRQNLQDKKSVYITGMGGVGKSSVA